MKARDMAQLVVCLPSVQEALGLGLSTIETVGGGTCL